MVSRTLTVVLVTSCAFIGGCAAIVTEFAAEAIVLAIKEGTSDEPRLRLGRAGVLQSQGRYTEAVRAYQDALEGAEVPDIALEKNYGLCLMVIGQWGAAEQVMRRIAEREPERWEPQYNIGVIRSILGDSRGASAALSRLRSTNPSMATALEAQYVGPIIASGKALGAGASAAMESDRSTLESKDRLSSLPELFSSDLETIAPPGVLPKPAISLGKKSLTLPPGRWMLATRYRFQAKGVIPGGTSTAATSAGVEPSVPALSGSVLQFGIDGELRAIAVFASNSIEKYDGLFFDPEPCDTGGAFIVGQSAYGQLPGSCNYARRLRSPADSTIAEVRGAHAQARRLGAFISNRWYEIRAAHYGVDNFWSLTFLWPATVMAGDLVAADWMRSTFRKVHTAVQNRETALAIERVSQ